MSYTFGTQFKSCSIEGVCRAGRDGKRVMLGHTRTRVGSISDVINNTNGSQTAPNLKENIGSNLKRDSSKRDPLLYNRAAKIVKTIYKHRKQILNVVEPT